METAHFFYLNGRQRPDAVDALLIAQLPIDAIQLASALRVADRTDNLVFVCADAKLARLASDEGLEVLNPLQAAPQVGG